MLNNLQVDLVILDIMLPRLDGLEVCRRLRPNSTIPIIMLTAKGDDVDRIVGLELGADDYLPKPFNTRELLARIRAVLRRVAPQAITGATLAPAEGPARPADVLTNGSLELRVSEQRVLVDGREIELTAREFELLHLLASHPGLIMVTHGW
jgi:DNA-binding response OmpR family regulator